MAGTSKKKSIKDRLKANHASGKGRLTKTVPVFLGADMALIEEYDTVWAQLNTPAEERQTDTAPRLGGGGSSKALAARLDVLREQLDEFRVDFVVAGLDDIRYERLQAAHPPRQLPDGKKDPRDNRWNSDTFPPALIRATVVEPKLDEEDWGYLLGTDEQPGQLSSGQQDALAVAAVAVSRTHADVPFWSAASTTIQNS